MRSASAADIDALVRLNRVVQKRHSDLQPLDFKAETDDAEVSAFIAALLTTPKNYLCVADCDGRSSGYIWFEKQDRPETPFTLARKRIYVHHIVVDEAVRRRGVAPALLRCVEMEALASGVRQIALDVWAENKMARDFFTSKGFSPFNLRLRKSLI